MSEIHEDAAAYALDVLDASEQEAFELHLAGCADCAAEVAELRATASQLVLSAGAPPLPPSLRASVLAGIADVEQLRPLTGRPRRALVSVEPDEPEVAPVAAAAADPVVDELALRRTSRRARVLSVLVAAVTVVALALGFTVFSLARQRTIVAEPAPSASVAQVDPSLLAAPDVRIRRATLPNGAQVSFVVSKSQSRAAFVSADLPSPGVGNQYQLWTLKGDTVVRPDSTLPGGQNQVQLFTGPINDSTALAVNIEPTGSKPSAPTTPVLGSVSI